jgi:sugar O-acyltransferase (sialic acid O-acetyltransferase NeuD family)
VTGAIRANHAVKRSTPPRLVIFGASNIVSDLFDCALANGLVPAKVVVHLPESAGAQGISLAARINALKGLCAAPQVEMLDDFQPGTAELYLLGPTTPTRANLAAELERRFGLRYHTLTHPTAYVSPLAQLGQGVFVGANSVIGPGAVLGDHVFVNRGVTIGHDTHIGAFSRIQPGANLGGLTRIGRGVTIAIGATLLERLVIGDGAFVGAGAVATEDVPDDVLVLGIPAKFKKVL